MLVIFFLMTGEAGVGKTRIVDELLSLLAGRNINFYRKSVAFVFCLL